jgi:hypothetical protein
MALRQGLPQTIVKLASSATQASASIYQLPIFVPRGTYIITGAISILATGGNHTGCYIGLQTTTGAPPAATTADVIFRNTSALVAASTALPSGANQVAQVLTFNTVYTAVADQTIYLNISANLTAGTWATIASGLTNQVTLTQIGF